MYEQIKAPRRVNERFLKKAFAPLEDYLNKEYPQSDKEIMAYMMYMGNDDNQYYYKNAQTKGDITFNMAGEVVSCSEDALQHQFDWGQKKEVEVPFEERFIHQSVTRWVQQHLKKQSWSVYQEVVSLFLQDVWGPLVNFDFEDLKPGYPLKLTSSTLYLTSPRYLQNITFQFAGDDIAMRKCSLNEYLRYEHLERDLLIKGWRVFTFCLDGIPDELMEPLCNFLEKEISDFQMDTSETGKT